MSCPYFDTVSDLSVALSVGVMGPWSGLPAAAVAALVVGPSQRRVIASTVAIVFLPLAAGALQLSRTPVDGAAAVNAAESARSTAKVRASILAAAASVLLSAVSCQVPMVASKLGLSIHLHL